MKESPGRRAPEAACADPEAAGVAAVEAALRELHRGSRPQEVAQAGQAVAAAREELDQARREHARTATLYEGGAAAREAFDRSATAVELAESRVAQAEERLERLFEFSDLGPFRERLAGRLSGGMKQKLGLSCALIHRPEVLLLDEPTFGVDPVSRCELWLIVHEMVAEGVTAVVSTAYLDEAERFDRVALLHQGRLLALDTPRALQGERTLEEVFIDRVQEAGRATN